MEGGGGRGGATQRGAGRQRLHEPSTNPPQRDDAATVNDERVVRGGGQGARVGGRAESAGRGEGHRALGQELVLAPGHRVGLGRGGG